MQPFQDRNVMNSSVPDYNVSQTKSQTFSDKGKPQRKRRKLPISEIRLMDASTDTEITMVDQACQTDLPFVVPSPHTFKSIPLADVRHAVANDHNYATLLSDSPVVPAEQVPGVSGKDFPKSKRTLDFSEMDPSDFPQIDCQQEEIEDEWIPSDESDYEESDVSDLSDYEVDEFSESFYSGDEDFDMKTETGIETLDKLHHNSPLVVCKNLTRQCYRLCGTMEIHRLPHG